MAMVKKILSDLLWKVPVVRTVLGYAGAVRVNTETLLLLGATIKHHQALFDELFALLGVSMAQQPIDPSTSDKKEVEKPN